MCKALPRTFDESLSQYNMHDTKHFVSSLETIFLPPTLPLPPPFLKTIVIITTMSLGASITTFIYKLPRS